MPQRKDPEIPVRVAVAACQWPGASAQEVEQLITRPIEQTIAQNKTIHPPSAADYGIRSISLPGASFVYVQLSADTKDSRTQFSDINLKLAGVEWTPALRREPRSVSKRLRRYRRADDDRRQSAD